MKFIYENSYRKPLQKIMILLMAISSPAWILCQDQSLDYYRNVGKIYVVVGVIILVFLGIVMYLIRLEKKIKKLEDSLNQN